MQNILFQPTEKLFCKQMPKMLLYFPEPTDTAGSRINNVKTRVDNK